jgi:catalase
MIVDSKDEALDAFRETPEGTVLTTDQGIRIPDTDNSLKAGTRGPTLLEDFHFREKVMRFDHERIPERVVHARGSGAHGYFQVYESLAEITKARFLDDPSAMTPVFVRFSTVVGSRGSADTVRDVRGFATKFYTDEGNFDLVGNNIPVFFIQDGIKFPDVVHAIKPEPHNEIPQAASAHDTFWDFVSLVPETAHMVMWLMSDRAIPRSFRMMEGFGVHTFRLVNGEGKTCLVKFHWKPLLGVHSLVWDEAQKLAGKDPDFHRRDLWDAIEKGHYPEYELGLQIVAEEEMLKFGFDLLDPTKILPEELVPVRRVGKLTLNRNPTNFFAETEQVAFCVANVVPGIDFTDDPLMQARLFSYLDTQLTRLGGPNFPEIPINRPLAPVHNHQQDGLMRQRIMTARASYLPNSIAGGCPMLASPEQGFQHFPEVVSGRKTRERSESFSDHFSQATLFFSSLSAAEQRHLIAALQFEVGKVERKEIRQRVVDLLANVDEGLACTVASGVGVETPQAPLKARAPSMGLTSSPSLSIDKMPRISIATRKVAVHVADGFSGTELEEVAAALEAAGAEVEVISPRLGIVQAASGQDVEANKNYLTAASVFYDAVFIPGGKASIETMKIQGFPIDFIREAYRHAKTVGATGEGVELLIEAGALSGAAGGVPNQARSERGVVTARDTTDMKAFVQDFIAAMMQHRHWDREYDETIPA